MAISQSTIDGISAAFAQPNVGIAISDLLTGFTGNEATALGFAANMAALADASASLVAKANPITAAVAFGLGATANLELASRQLKPPSQNGQGFVSASTALEAGANLTGVVGSVLLGLSAAAATGAAAPALAAFGVAALAGALGATLWAKLMDDNLSIDQAISNIQQSISDMANAFGDAFSDAVNAFTNGLQSLSSGDWFNDMLDSMGPPIISGAIGIGNFLNGIAGAINQFFNTSRTVVGGRRDPLALDLDGDGIETVGANGTVLFDHDGDGVKTGTGWVRPDDGLLVLDRNGNGLIDNGSELFGVDTVLANGQKATDGFAALRDLDVNGDNVFNALDTRFGDVRVWRDLNQDGISQASELFTLQTLGITAINLNATAEAINLGGGNVQTATASYVRTDGSVGETASVGLGETAANLEFAVNPFYREFTTAIPLTTEALALPDMKGSGSVRDLREAVSLSPALAAILTQYAQQTTRAGQYNLIDDLLTAWGDTSVVATSIEQGSNFGYRLIYVLPWQAMSQYESLLPYWDADEAGLASLTEEDRQTLAQLKIDQAGIAQRIEMLEQFNGMSFVAVDATGVNIGQGARRDVGTTPGANAVSRVYVQLVAEQLWFMDETLRLLEESVYSGLLTQTRLSSYLDEISMQLAGGGVRVDFTAMTDALVTLRQTDVAKALTDMIDLHKSAGTLLYSMGWNELPMLRSWLESAANDPQFESMLMELGFKRDWDGLWDSNTTVSTSGSGDDVFLMLNANNSGWGGAGNDLIFGSSDDDIIDGSLGNDIIDGGLGNDGIEGGAGNDVLNGGAGDDFLSVTSSGFRFVNRILSCPLAES